MARGRGLLSGVSRLQLLVAGLVVAGGVGLTAFAGSLVVAVMTAVGAIGGGTSLWVLLGLLLVVLGSGVVAAGALAWLAWLGLAQLRVGVSATYRRLLFWAYHRSRAFEDHHALGALLQPSRVFASRSARDGPLVTELKSRYVAGEIGEAQFERELRDLLGDGASTQRVRREITVTAPDGGEDDDQVGESDDHVDGADDGTTGDAASERAGDNERERERA